MKIQKKNILVVKYGGNAILDKPMAGSVLADISFLSQLGLQIVLVHGGGPMIDKSLEKKGIKKKMVNGLRVTHSNALQVIKEVLTDINTSLVCGLMESGAKAVDCTNGLFKTEVTDASLGHVGEITKVNTDILTAAMQEGMIPVISSIGRQENGGWTNINADTAACKVAEAIGAGKMTLLTNVSGVMINEKPVSSITIAQAMQHITNGEITRGMIPKVLACIYAINNGINAQLIDGTTRHALLLEAITGNASGTVVVKDDN